MTTPTQISQTPSTEAAYALLKKATEPILEALAASQIERDQAQQQVAELTRERDSAVAFSSKVERGEVSFAKNCDAQLERISKMPLGKTVHENLADAVFRIMTERDTAISSLTQLRAELAETKGMYRIAFDAQVANLKEATNLSVENEKLRAEVKVIRGNCRVVLYVNDGQGDGGKYPIEHNPHAGKDQWDNIVAALKDMLTPSQEAGE